MHKHTVDLLERLFDASEEGRIKWAEVPGKTAYSYLAGDFIVLIDATAEHTIFRLSDAKGKSLEQAGTDDLLAANLASGATALSAVLNIHAIAKRQTMGTDEAIASVLGHLQNLSADGEAGAIEETPAAEDNDEANNITDEVGETDYGSQPAEVSHQDLAITEPADEIGEEPAVEELPVLLTEEIIPEAAQKAKQKKRSLFSPFGNKK